MAQCADAKELIRVFLWLLLLGSCRLFADYEFTNDSGVGDDPVISGELLDFFTKQTLSGVEVCVYGMPELPCVVSDLTGHYELFGAPGGETGALQFLRDGYQPSLLFLAFGERDYSMDWELVALEHFTLLSIGADPPVDPLQATVIAGASGAIDGSYHLEPADAEGPVYLGGFGIDFEAVSIVEEFGIFYNVPAGQYTLSLTHPTASCERSGVSWPAEGAHEAIIEAVPGFLCAGPRFICNSDIGYGGTTRYTR
jgi:hypothetical protein